MPSASGWVYPTNSVGRDGAGVEADRHLLGGLAGARPLLLEKFREPIRVDAQTGVTQQFLGELDREPVGVG